MSGGKGGGSTTVGYKYYVGMHMALCHGPIDKILEIKVDGRVAWEGTNQGSDIDGDLEIDAGDLFGGKGREGGIEGTLQIEMGRSDQTTNSYLTSVLGDDVPPFRGVTCAVLNQVYVGNNPYLKPWAFHAQRIHTTTDGDEQWYDAKSGISRRSTSTNLLSDECLPYDCQAYEKAIENSYPIYWWPADNDPDDGYLAGRNATPDAPTEETNNSMRKASIFNDVTCASDPGWWFFDTDGYDGIEPDALAPIPYDSELWFSVLHYNYGGTTDTEMLDVDLVWPTTTVGFNAEIRIRFIPFANGTFRIGVDGTNISENDYLETGVIPDDGKAHVLAARVLMPPSAIADSETVSFSVFMYIDWTYIGQKTFEITNYTGKGDASYSASAPTAGYELANGTVDAYFAHYTLHTGPVDTKALRIAYERNFEDWEIPDTCLGFCQDMNPAHIIRECLTDPDWGLGYSSSDIDEDSFTAAADTLYDEYMGISILWQREIELEDFIAEILQHIDAVLYVSRTSGKFVLKLIRYDYSLSALTVLDETSVVSVKNPRRPAVGDLTTSVTVNFYDAETGETGSVTVHNQALVQIQGSTTHAMVPYPGFTNYSIAERVATRDLQALSVPLLSCTIVANRDAAVLNIGDAFILDWPDIAIYDLVMRVQKIEFGDNRKNAVTIEAVEDVFATPTYGTLGEGEPEDNLWVDPATQSPEEAIPRLVTEYPYWVARQTGNEEWLLDAMLGDDPDIGWLIAISGRQNNEVAAQGHIDYGGSYDNDWDFILNFSPYAILAEDIGYTDTRIYYNSAKDIEDVTSGMLLQIDEELMRVDALGTDSNGSYVDVGRGVLDTVPAEHPVSSPGPYLLFWEFYTIPGIQFTLGETAGVKLATVRGSNVLPLADTPEDSYTFASRLQRPYPPGLLAVDGESYPEIGSSSEIEYTGTHTLTWTHRDRRQQTDAYLYDYTAGDIGPEAGTTYLVEAYSTLIDGTESPVWLSKDVGSATSFDQDSDVSADSALGEPPADTKWVHFRVTARRDGYDSWQSPSVTLSYADFDSSGLDSVGDSIGDSSGLIDSVGDSVGIDSVGDSVGFDSSGPWTPEASSPALWLDASDASTITEVASAVSQWDDRSGNDRHATQGTASNRPVYSATAFNGTLPGIDFATDHKLLEVTRGFITDEFSVFVVYDGGNINERVIDQRGTGAFGTVQGWFVKSGNTNANDLAGAEDGSSNYRSRNESPSTTVLTSPRLSSTVFPNPSTGNLDFYFDGTINGLTNNSGSLPTDIDNTGVDVGIGGSTATSDQTYTGIIGEIIVLDRYADDDERQRFEGYLAHKWGMADDLYVFHPYKSHPPYYDSGL